MADTPATATTPKPKAKPKAKPAAKKTTTARKAAPVTPSTPVQRVQDAAEKAVLVQVGAALIARDHVVDAVTGIAGTDLKSAERRGAAVRKDLETRVRKTRTRVEKEIHTRRTAVTKRATANRKRVEHDIKSLRTQFEARAASPRAAVDQIVETGRTVGAKVADRVPKVPTRA